MNEEITIFGIAGSIRRHSYNRMALNTAKELMPGGVTLDIFADLAAIPPFNEDTEFMPEPVVVDLKARIRNASGVLIVTPEYNYGIPGVLKNAIDQASRPSGDNVWDGKPVAIMGASISAFGSARAQYQLRQSFAFLNMHAINQPEVMIPNAAEQFDANGALTNAVSRKLMGELLENLVDRAIEYERKTPEIPFSGFRPRGVAPRKS
jgi:chromate reductase